jgi:AcrR family transcriptional regulator
MRARAESTAETRAGIIRAVLELHMERFHNEITLELVADRAGVTVQTVLRHFGSRDGLITAAADQATQEVLAQRSAAPVGDVDGAHVALAHGVPLVCPPIGRDQPDNAARVAWHGAGLRLSSTSSPAAIGRAVERVLGERAFAASARRLATAFAEEHAADRAPKALESLAGRTPPDSGAVRRSVAPPGAV